MLTLKLRLLVKRINLVTELKNSNQKELQYEYAN